MHPKYIHYCWFGQGPLPKQTKKYIESWRRHLKGYALQCWDESNFSIDDAPAYVQEAYAAKKYAFVSDYVRLYALYHQGGVYLDTDVEVIKDFTKLLTSDTVLGYEDIGKITTAFIAAPPQAAWIGEILGLYEKRHFRRPDGSMDMTTNVAFISDYLKRKGIALDNTYTRHGDIEIYPAEYFSPRSWEDGGYHITDNTYTIHYFAGTWHSPLNRLLSRFLSNATVYKIAAWKDKIRHFIKR